MASKASPAGSIYSDCSNHSPCFIHTESAIKHIAENANEFRITSLTVWMAVLSSHLTPPNTHTHKIRKIVIFSTKQRVDMCVTLWSYLICGHAWRWTSSGPPQWEVVSTLSRTGRCAQIKILFSQPQLSLQTKIKNRNC